MICNFAPMILLERGTTMRKGLTIAAALTLIPAAALAHPGPLGHTHDLTQPLGGLDVLMAMVTVGILALAAWRSNLLTR
jgi:hydrogenase/urease accessory protein HupE